MHTFWAYIASINVFWVVYLVVVATLSPWIDRADQ